MTEQGEAEDFEANLAIDREREDRPTTYVTENLDYKERGPADRDARALTVLTPKRPLAAKLIEKAALPDFQIAAYADPTETALRTLIDAKLKGEALTVAPLAPAKPNLLDALTAMAET